LAAREILSLDPLSNTIPRYLNDLHCRNGTPFRKTSAYSFLCLGPHIGLISFSSVAANAFSAVMSLVKNSWKHEVVFRQTAKLILLLIFSKMGDFQPQICIFVGNFRQAKFRELLTQLCSSSMSRRQLSHFCDIVFPSCLVTFPFYCVSKHVEQCWNFGSQIGQ